MRAPRDFVQAARRRVAGQRRVTVPPAQRRRVENREPGVPRSPFQGFQSLLPARSDRVVAVLAHHSQRDLLTPWLAQFPSDRVHVISAESAPEWDVEGMQFVHHPVDTAAQAGWELKRIGAVDVLVNLLTAELLPSDAANHYEMFWRVFFHLTPGGVYLLDRSSPPGAEFGESVSAWMSMLAETDSPQAQPQRSGREAELFTSISAIAVSRDVVTIRKRGKHYVKLRDSEVTRMLGPREPRITVSELTTLPAGEHRSRAVVTSHAASVPIDRLPENLAYPQLHLRHYEGRIAFAGSTLMFGDYSILPDSFRHHLAGNFSNARITNVSPLFARIPASLQPTEVLPGNYYQLDSTFAGHFGHFTTEVLSRFWGWETAKASIPDLKVILRKFPKDLEPKLDRDFFRAYGIADSDIVWTDNPVFLESVVSASPMWHNEEPYYAHPDLQAVWDRLAEVLVDASAATPEHIFVSRSSRWGRRTCRNATDVEQFFQDRGFTIVYPEHLDLSEQATVFANARIIAGFGGSAMFNMMYAKNMTTAIVLSHEAYTARNEHLFTSLLGGDVHYFWSSPDVAHPEKGWSQDAFYSDWDFDFERNRASLGNLLSSL